MVFSLKMNQLVVLSMSGFNDRFACMLGFSLLVLSHYLMPLNKNSVWERNIIHTSLCCSCLSLNPIVFKLTERNGERET